MSLKVRIEVDENLIEDEVIIRCRDINKEVVNIKQSIADVINEKKTLVCTREKTEYFIAIDAILFVETDSDKIVVHTIDNIYYVKMKLYEMEQLLPGFFCRCSKSAIVNLNMIYSIERNISSTSIISFKNSDKKVYVSRRYYGLLKERKKSY